MHESKLSMSAKGKAREETHWQLGWWDLEPLTSSSPKAIAWSRSSVIFTPHATQPLVLARHFPSSRQFILPSPTTWANPPTPYEPPSIITVSPTEDWLFAYFPGRDGDGACCLWRKGQQLDSWTIQEWWTLAKGNGVVTAEWLCGERDWIVNEGSQPYRLPPRGPMLPIHASILILVTQSHQVHVCFLPPAFPAFKILKASLSHHSLVSETTPQPEDFPTNSHGGQRVCKYAAIGLNYNEPTIMFATRSFLLPISDNNQSSFNTMDLGLHLDIPESTSPGSNALVNEWEQWGEESTIELSMLILKCGGPTAMRIVPLAPLRYPGAQLTALRFCSVPPDIVPPSPTITRDPRRPVKDGLTERGFTYLIASSLDFGDYTSLPRSEIKSFSLARPKNGDPTHWTVGDCTRAFDVGTVAFIAPSPTPKRLTVGFLDSSGTIHRHAKAKEVPIGSMALLNPADLSTDEQWESAHLFAPIDGVGRDSGLTVSPNHSLICSISPSMSYNTRTTAHSLPQQQHRSNSGPFRSDLSRALVSSILARKSPSDIIHALSTQVSLMEVVLATLHNSLSLLETYSPNLQDMWIEEMLGIATEVYLERSQRAESDADKATLKTYGHTARDLRSLSAMNSAFEDCRDGDAYDLSAVWQLVGLSLWFVDFTERLLRECVYAGNDVSIKTEPNATPDDLFNRNDASIFVSLLHPYALRHFVDAIGHVRRFYDDLRALTPKSENGQMARDVFMDGIDGAGVQLEKLEPLLQELKTEAKTLPADDLKKSLLSCSVAPSLRRFLRQAVDKVLSSDAIDKLRLFVKPSDLMDGVSRMSIAEQLKERESDIVTKGVLLHTGTSIVCVRCGGRSEINNGNGAVAGHVSLRWNVWERVWSSRCICGGAWIRPTL